MPLWDHLKALRKALIVSAYAVAAGTAGGWVLSGVVFKLLAAPVEMAGVPLISIGVMDQLMVKLKLSLITGVIIAAPVVIWQIWAFVLPALTRSEKKMVYLVSLPSIILFIGGILFAFFIVLPLGLKFLFFIGGDVVDTVQSAIADYLGFVTAFLLTFGCVFQLPIVLLVLIRLEIITPAALGKYRKYAFFIIVVTAVILSPTPDLATQALMISPMYLLYELSIWVGYLMVRRRRKQLARVEAGGKEGPVA
ncbi:MAG: twin-arginine translocase subunit TatC [Gracilibacteraceae bacterium]|jgi:sec-independent protein translocase protein TatC|nr:twin-arginine translocase subunit TatC [Gracilibacteraceae bacterium]